MKSPGFKRRKIPVCRLHPEEPYQNAASESEEPTSIFKRPTVDFSVSPVWESIWLNGSLETSTLYIHYSLISCITPIWKLKTFTLKHTYRQNHSDLAHFCTIWLFCEAIGKCGGKYTRKDTSIWHDVKFCGQHGEGCWRKLGRVPTVVRLTKELECVGLGRHIKH